MKDYLEFVFVKDHLILNILAALSFGGCVGYAARLGADSEQAYGPDLYLQFAIVSASGMLLATLISYLIQRRLRIVPSFLLLGFLGPLFMFFGYRMWMMFCEGAGLNALETQLRSDFGASVLMGFFGFLPFVSYLVIIRTITYITTNLIYRSRPEAA